MLPDVAPSDQQVPLEDPLYDLASFSQSGEGDRASLTVERLTAIATMLGLETTNLSQEEIMLLVAQASHLDKCWLQDEVRQDTDVQMDYATESENDESFDGCMMASVKDGSQPTRIRDEFVSEVYTSR
jgi:hypothetical protein